jgi:hypothetical protein
LFHTLFVLAGIVVTRGIEAAPIALFYLFVIGIVLMVVLIVVDRVLSKRGKTRSVESIRTLVGRPIGWVLGLGVDFTVGAGFGILLAAGLGNGGGWVLFVVYFALAVEMNTVKEAVPQN